MRSRSDFIRAMIFDGIIVHFDEKELRKTNQVIANIGNNINQIAVLVNSNGRIYDEDFAEIQNGQREIFNALISVLKYFVKSRR